MVTTSTSAPMAMKASHRLNTCAAAAAVFVSENESIKRGERDIAEITEPHRALAHGMMARRAHQTERPVPFQRLVGGVDCGAGGTRRVIINPGIGRRVSIEIVSGLPNSLQMTRRVGAKKDGLCGRLRFPPFPFRMVVLEKWDGFFDSGGPLRMAGRGIIDTPRIVENEHWARNWRN